MATSSSAIQKKIETLKKGLNNKFITAAQKEKIKAQVQKLESQSKASAPKKATKPAASSSLTRLQKLVKNKKYGVYKGAGVDLKKDSDRPAKAIGKRISKNGKTYYEYRANRIDVKQPPKRYPKLEKGGYMAKGGGIYSSDNLYILKVLKKGQKEVATERFRAKSLLEAKEIVEDEYVKKYESKFGNELSFIVTEAMAEGGRVKGRNNETGETYGVVIGSVKKSDDNIEGGTEMNVRKSYSSRISEVKLVFDKNANLYEITDFGYGLEGNYPDTSRGSGKNYNADKKETLEVLSKKYNPAFAKKLIELAKNPKMAEGGMTEHGLRIGDKITTDMFWDNQIVVENTKTNKRAQIDLETGKRKDEMEKGGEVDRERMYNFLKDDLAALEKAIEANNQEEINDIFLYWNRHLKDLEPKTGSKRMYEFLKDDLVGLEAATKELPSSKEETDRFFSYWNIHLKSLEPVKGGYMAEGGDISVYNLRKGDKVKTRKGDIETIIRKTGSGSYETIESEYTHSPESLEFVSRPGRKMEDGGVTEKEVVESNADMVLSQIKAVKHHAEELSSVVSRKSNIEAWVVGKIERASTDLSDITHYLEGNKDKMSMGGTVRYYAHKMDKK